MTITDDTNTLTTSLAMEDSEPIFNASTVVTTGGVVRQQADASRLRIAVRMYLTEAETATLMSIATSYEDGKKYTPSKALWGKTAIETVDVVITKFPMEANYFYADETIRREVRMELEEVIGL